MQGMIDQQPDKPSSDRSAVIEGWDWQISSHLRQGIVDQQTSRAENDRSADISDNTC